jgi:phage shock protein A
MSTPTDIEKKSLEAHVELCAERYKNLDDKLDTVEKRVAEVERKLEAKITAVEQMLDEIKDMIVKMQHHRNNQLITWGSAVIASLISAIVFLVWRQIG